MFQTEQNVANLDGTKCCLVFLYINMTQFGLFVLLWPFMAFCVPALVQFLLALWVALYRLFSRSRIESYSVLS